MIKYLLIFISAALISGCVSNKHCVGVTDKDGVTYIKHSKECKSPWWEHALTAEEEAFWLANPCEDMSKRKYFR